MKDIFYIQNPSYDLRSSCNQLSRSNKRHAPTACVRHTLPKKGLSNYLNILPAMFKVATYIFLHRFSIFYILFKILILFLSLLL